MAQAKFNIFPSCCGIGIVHEAMRMQTSDTQQHVKAAIQERIHEEQRKTRENLIRRDLCGCGLMLYAATDSQVDLQDTLQKLGFTPLHTFTNPKTGRVITLYGLDLTKEK